MNKQNLVKKNQKIETRNELREHLATSAAIERKELNSTGKIVIVFMYTALIILVTKLYTAPAKNVSLLQNFNEIRVSQNQILERIEKREDRKTVSSPGLSQKVLFKEIKDVKNELSSLIKEDNYSEKVIDDQKLEIHELKQKIKSLIAIRKDDFGLTGHKTVIFNEANYKSLEYRHRLKEKRLRQKHKESEEGFLKVFDINDVHIQSSFRDFQDNNKIAQKELQNKHRVQRKEFRKEKFLVRN